MSTTVEAFRHRLDWSALTAGVAVGDFLLIGAFVIAGELSHGVDIAAYPGQVLGTYATFAFGWLVTSVLGGLHTVDARTTPKRAVAWTAPAWVGAAIIALLLRATPVFHGSFSPIFLLVAIAVGSALLVPYRALVAYFT